MYSNNNFTSPPSLEVYVIYDIGNDRVAINSFIDSIIIGIGVEDTG
jgi:hypothetical protein